MASASPSPSLSSKTKAQALAIIARTKEAAARVTDAALRAKAEHMVLDMVARVEAGEDITSKRMIARKVVRLSEDKCKKVMTMPWPPVMPRAFSEDRCDDVKDPELRERMRRVRADAARHLKRIHDYWALVREQYAAHGYGDVIMDVDEDGIEWIPAEM
ncbi:hypothetical protein PR202_gb08424 [Eleusine coracana subsp. coracana]|uniref:Uncharacterized protein n=1 Tax=Eleusine coracana subsp. coracana TaxID=191504 RepID=A0AAV5EFH3_ELECO|nr:hypothetical protein PR202_gb08424 [Eleusine coracana subsp. coracana]